MATSAFSIGILWTTTAKPEAAQPAEGGKHRLLVLPIWCAACHADRSVDSQSELASCEVSPAAATLGTSASEFILSWAETESWQLAVSFQEAPPLPVSGLPSTP